MSLLHQRVIVDSRGRWCPPTPLTDLFKAYRRASFGSTVELWASEPGIESDVRAWATKTGNKVISVAPKEDYLKITVEVASRRKSNRT